MSDSIPSPWLRRVRPPFPAVLAAALVGSASCGDLIDPIEFVANADTVVLFSLARPELNLPSGYSFNARRRIVVEAPGATGQWDVAIDTRDGRIVLLPPFALGVQSVAAVAAMPGRRFDEVLEAPTDTAAYAIDRPVPVELGSTYVVRTNLQTGAIAQCIFFAKLEPLDVDVEGGSLTFIFDANPRCNDRNLVPKAGGDGDG